MKEADIEMGRTIASDAKEATVITLRSIYAGCDKTIVIVGGRDAAMDAIRAIQEWVREMESDE